jgi:DNA mismatch repair protein MutS
MTFQSILFLSATGPIPDEQPRSPDFFADLNLDQIVAAVTAGKEEYNLTPFFHLALHDVDAITYRHEVMQDLEGEPLFDNIKAFALSMRSVREHLAQLEEDYCEHQKERWFLDAVHLYGDAVNRLSWALSEAKPGSRGIVALRDYLARYTSSARFTSLVEEAKLLEQDLAAIRYSVFMEGRRVEVHHYAGKPDYSAEVEATFERFQQGNQHEYTFRFNESLEMNHIEAKILDGVAQLHPDTFSKLRNFCATKKDFLDPAASRFDREIQFYVAYLEYINGLKKSGLNFCYPVVSASRKEIFDYQGFDLALAVKLANKNAIPVCNDFDLKDPERIIVISGPNQGGKTTFARTFGQLHYLASLGCPVPGTKAQLYLTDRIFTHFEREEHMANLRGKLEDDILRIHDILEVATSHSVIIINEIFASTALRDVIFLSRKLADRITALDLLCVWVTFVDEVSSLSEKTVSMVSSVVPENPVQRTFKILRRPADGLAYAMSLAEKHGLTYEQIKERVGHEGSFTRS